MPVRSASRPADTIGKYTTPPQALGSVGHGRPVDGANVGAAVAGAGDESDCGTPPACWTAERCRTRYWPTTPITTSAHTTALAITNHRRLLIGDWPIGAGRSSSLTPEFASNADPSAGGITK
jgi:hypothetical protein